MTYATCQWITYVVETGPKGVLEHKCFLVPRHHYFVMMYIRAQSEELLRYNMIEVLCELRSQPVIVS